MVSLSLSYSVLFIIILSLIHPYIFQFFQRQPTFFIPNLTPNQLSFPAKGISFYPNSYFNTTSITGEVNINNLNIGGFYLNGNYIGNGKASIQLNSVILSNNNYIWSQFAIELVQNNPTDFSLIAIINIWNFTTSNSSVEGISGNGNIVNYNGRTLYYYSKYLGDFQIPLNFTLNQTIDSSEIYFSITLNHTIVVDQVNINHKGIFIAGGYSPSGYRNDIELVLGGPGNGTYVYVNSINATFSLKVLYGNQLTPVPVAYSNSMITGEGVINVSSVPYFPNSLMPEAKLITGNSSISSLWPLSVNVRPLYPNLSFTLYYYNFPVNGMQVGVIINNSLIGFLNVSNGVLEIPYKVFGCFSFKLISNSPYLKLNFSDTIYSFQLKPIAIGYNGVIRISSQYEIVNLRTGYNYLLYGNKGTFLTPNKLYFNSTTMLSFWYWNISDSMVTNQTIFPNCSEVLELYFVLERTVIVLYQVEGFQNYLSNNFYIYWVRVDSGILVQAPPYYNITNNSRLLFIKWNDNSTQLVRWVTVQNGPVTLIAIYKLQYSVIIKLNPLGIRLMDSWEDYGTTLNISAPQYYYLSNNTRYKFINWSNGVEYNEIQLKVDKPINLTANYVLQYLVVIIGFNSTIEGWFNNNTILNLSPIKVVYISPLIRFVFIGFQDNFSSEEIKVNSPVYVRELYREQFLVTIKYLFNKTSLWSNNGTTLNISAPQYYYLSNNTRYKFINWSNGVEYNEIQLKVDKPINLTANYVLQYLVNINNTLKWFDNGSKIELTYQRVNYVNQYERIVLDYFNVSGKIINTTSLYITVTTPLNISIVLSHQFFVSISNVNLTKSINGWFNLGHVINLYTMEEINVSNNERYVFSNWYNPLYSLSYSYQNISLIVNSPIFLVANYTQEVLIIVNVPFNESREWVPLGSLFTYFAPREIALPRGGEKLVFLNWSNGDTSNYLSLIANSPMNITANYYESLRVTLINYTGLNQTVWVRKGSEVTFETPEVIYLSNDTRLVFNGWSNGGKSSELSLRIMNPVTLYPIYKTQFLVSVLTPFFNVTKWYDQGEIVNIIAPRVIDLFIFQYLFNGWNYKGDKGNLVTLVVNSPIILRADYTFLTPRTILSSVIIIGISLYLIFKKTMKTRLS